MKNAGSLKDFIDFPIIEQNIPNHYTNHQHLNQFCTDDVRSNKYPHKFDKIFQQYKGNKSSSMQERKQPSIKRRAKTMLSQYQASRKYMKDSIINPAASEEIDWKEDYYQYIHQRFKVNFSGRAQKNKNATPSYRGTIFPKKEYLLQFSKRSRPQMKDTLLRGLTKLEQIQKNKFHQISEPLQHHIHEKLEKSQKSYLFKEIRLDGSKSKNNRKHQSQDLQNSHEGKFSSYYLPHSPKKQMQRKISSLKRIQFQNCLTWARKHRKNGSYYEKLLCKNVKYEKIEDTYRQRQKIMKQLYNKSGEKHPLNSQRTVSHSLERKTTQKSITIVSQIFKH